MTVRGQPVTWRTLKGMLDDPRCATEPSTAECRNAMFSAWWPIIKRLSDARWTREKIVSLPDTMAVPAHGYYVAGSEYATVEFLAVEPAVWFTPPDRLADSQAGEPWEPVRYLCSGSVPLSGSVTMELSARRQSGTWADAPPESLASATWFVRNWPTVRAEALSEWRREKVMVAGVRDSLRYPVGYRWITVRGRHAISPWSCAAGVGVP